MQLLASYIGQPDYNSLTTGSVPGQFLDWRNYTSGQVLGLPLISPILSCLGTNCGLLPIETSY